jgi:hypothetical protein
MKAEKDGIRYFNSGCWTNNDPTYIAVNHSGVQIRRYLTDSALLQEAGMPAPGQPSSTSQTATGRSNPSASWQATVEGGGARMALVERGCSSSEIKQEG